MKLPALATAVFVFAGILPASLRAQGGPPEGPAPAEKKDAGHSEETWFKVVFRKEVVGWSHAWVDKIPDGGKLRAWRIGEERELTPIKGLPVAYSGRSSIVLTDRWTMVEGEWGGYWSGEVDDAELRFRARLIEDGTLWIDGPAGSAQVEKFTETDWGIDPMLGKFLLSKGLVAGKTHGFKPLTGQPPPQHLADANVQVKEEGTLNTEAGTFSGFTCTVTLPAVLPVQKDPLTWNLFVDKAAGKVVRMALASEELVFEAVEEKWVREGRKQQMPFAARGRRDPFRNPMIPKPAGGPAGGQPFGPQPTAQAPTLSPEDRKEMEQQARDLVAKMERDNADAALPRDLRLTYLRQTYDELNQLISVAEDKEKREIKWVERMRKIRKAAQEIYSGVERLASDMERILLDAQGFFETDNYKALADKLTEAKTIYDNPVIKETKFEKEIRNNYNVVKELRERARKRETFAQKKPQIIGIIYYLVPEPVALAFGVEILGRRIEGENRVEIARSHSTAILKLGAEPQIVADGADVDRDLRVHKIERHAVVFSFQGEQIRVDLGRE